MNIKIFCRCSLFPSWSGKELISTPVNGDKTVTTERHWLVSLASWLGQHFYILFLY